MAGISENNRQRVALALVGLSAGLIMLGFGMIIHHVSLPEVQPIATRPVILDHKTKIMMVRQVLFWVLILVLIFGVSTLAFLRWSRHFRRRMFYKPRPPTPSDDVWAMHKLPEDALEEWNEEGGSSDGRREDS